MCGFRLRELLPSYEHERSQHTNSVYAPDSLFYGEIVGDLCELNFLAGKEEWSLCVSYVSAFSSHSVLTRVSQNEQRLSP
jgi:hypothetical protein